MISSNAQQSLGSTDPLFMGRHPMNRGAVAPLYQQKDQPTYPPPAPGAFPLGTTFPPTDVKTITYSRREGPVPAWKAPVPRQYYPPRGPQVNFMSSRYDAFGPGTTGDDGTGATSAFAEWHPSTRPVQTIKDTSASLRAQRQPYRYGPPVSAGDRAYNTYAQLAPPARAEPQYVPAEPAVAPVPPQPQHVMQGLPTSGEMESPATTAEAIQSVWSMSAEHLASRQQAVAKQVTPAVDFPSPTEIQQALSVAGEFAYHYFHLMQTEPDKLHCFYSSDSQLAHGSSVMEHTKWHRAIGESNIERLFDSVLASGMEGGNSLIVRSNVKTIEAQPTRDGGIVMQATGIIETRDLGNRPFAHTIVMNKAPNEGSYVVLHDIFVFLDDVLQVPPTINTHSTTSSTAFVPSSAARQAAATYVEQPVVPPPPAPIEVAQPQLIPPMIDPPRIHPEPEPEEIVEEVPDVVEEEAEEEEEIGQPEEYVEEEEQEEEEEVEEEEQRSADEVEDIPQAEPDVVQEEVVAEEEEVEEAEEVDVSVVAEEPPAPQEVSDEEVVVQQEEEPEVEEPPQPLEMSEDDQISVKESIIEQIPEKEVPPTVTPVNPWTSHEEEDMSDGPADEDSGAGAAPAPQTPSEPEVVEAPSTTEAAPRQSAWKTINRAPAPPPISVEPEVPVRAAVAPVVQRAHVVQERAATETTTVNINAYEPNSYVAKLLQGLQNPPPVRGHVLKRSDESASTSPSTREPGAGEEGYPSKAVWVSQLDPFSDTQIERAVEERLKGCPIQGRVIRIERMRNGSAGMIELDSEDCVPLLLERGLCINGVDVRIDSYKQTPSQIVREPSTNRLSGAPRRGLGRGRGGGSRESLVDEDTENRAPNDRPSYPRGGRGGRGGPLRGSRGGAGPRSTAPQSSERSTGMPSSTEADATGDWKVVSGRSSRRTKSGVPY